MSQEPDASVQPFDLVTAIGDALRVARGGLVVASDGTWSNRDLDLFSGGVAEAILARGIGRDDMVGVSAARSVYSIGAMLGALRAGVAYVPLDPHYPIARLRSMLEDTRCVLVLADELSVALFREAFPGEVIAAPSIVGAQFSTSDGLDTSRSAYVLFTSGSTGRPKGVIVERAQLDNYTKGIVELLDAAPEDNFALVQPLTFGSCLTMLYPALVSGASLHVVRYQIAVDADAYASYARSARIDYLKVTPSHLRALLSAASPADVLPRKALVIGGERSPLGWLRSVKEQRPDMRVIHHYGSTETTVGVSTLEIDAASSALDSDCILGPALPGVLLHVRDNALRPANRGQLCVSGRNVFRGYVGSYAGDEAFFVDAATGARMFQTGDMVESISDGLLRFLGRRDDQVKLRGYRIELGDIEAALRSCSLVKEASAALLDVEAEEPVLMAWFEPHDWTSDCIMEVRKHLRDTLPSYAVPRKLAALPRLPRTSTQKINRRALTSIESVIDRLSSDRRGIARLVATAWTDVGLSTPGIGDDFFESGGDSLRATRIAARLGSWLSRHVPVNTILANPTFEDMVTALETADS